MSEQKDDKPNELDSSPPPDDPEPTPEEKDILDEFIGPPVSEAEQGEYECPECHERFDTVGKKNLHYENKHVRAGQPKDKYCPKCHAGPYTEMHLKRHDTMVHKKKEGSEMENGDLPLVADTGGVPDTSPPNTSEQEQVREADVVEFKGKHSYEKKRRDALIKGLEIFPWKKSSKEYIIRSWDSIPAIREDDRDFFDLLNEISEIEPTQARRLVDIVFDVETSQRSPETYVGRRRYPSEYEAPSYHGGRRGGEGWNDEYEPRGRPPPRGYDERQAPPRRYIDEQPRYAPPTEDPRAIEERVRMEYELRDRESKMESMRKEMESMREMIENPPPPPPTQRNSEQSEDMKEMKKRLAETEKALDRAENDRELEAIKRHNETKMSRLEAEIEADRRRYEDIQARVNDPSRNNPGLSDNAQVALKELDTKMTIMMKGMSDFSDIAKTIITAGRPIQPPGRSPNHDERDRLRRELGEDAE